MKIIKSNGMCDWCEDTKIQDCIKLVSFVGDGLYEGTNFCPVCFSKLKKLMIHSAFYET